MENKKKKERAKKGQKDAQLTTKQRKERASPSHDRKLSHPHPLTTFACKSRDLMIVEGLK
jgi:hypothetical protein